MGKNDNVKKGTLLLLSMCIYAFFLIFVFNEKSISVEQKNVEVKTELVAVKNDFEYREIRELENVEVLKENLDDEGEVEGIIDRLMGTCGSKFSIEEPQLFCGGSGLPKNAEIVIAEIYAPAVLFAGAEKPFDNLVQTNNPEGATAFRNAAETIHAENDYLIKQPPLPSSREQTLSEQDAYEPFGMHFGVMGNVSKVDFDSQEESKCPDVVNRGEFNVKNTNVLQDDLTRTFTPPGVMALGDRDYSGRLCREENRKIELTKDESFLLCSEGVLDILKNFFCERLPTFKDKCDGLEGIVIDAPLGSGEVCNEEDCGIRYWEASRINSSPPTYTRDLYPAFLEDSEKEDDYIVDDLVVLTTPCKVRVDCKLCETKCYWDISVWQHIYDLEQSFTYPGFENRMKEDEYWQKVEVELKKRGVASNSR